MKEPKFRPCVGIMLINKVGLVWIGKRLMRIPANSGTSLWQMPQGGIDQDESPLAAARRELYEETSIKNISLVDESEEWFSYLIPSKTSAGRPWKGNFQGQNQKWFAFRFEGKDSEVNISDPPDGHKPEFDDWRWEKVTEIPDLVIPFKRDVYKQVVRLFSKHCQV